MESGVGPDEPRYRVLVISVNSPFLSWEMLSYLSCQKLCLVDPREILEWVCFLLEGRGTQACTGLHPGGLISF